MSTLLHLLVLLHIVVLTNANDHDRSTSEVCTTPQHLRMGETGVIECQFGNFYSVYWYNSTDSEKENPLVAMKDSLKTGEGYESGQFDVFPNGSFIIRTVSLLHDHSFRVIMLKNKDGDDYVIRDIDVCVIVASHQPHPYINICGQKAFCFAKLGENYQIDCTVNETRPAANLTWAQRQHTLGNQDVPSEEVTVQRNTMYSATSKTMTKFEETQTALLLVCKVSGPPHVISKSESMVFIENINKEYPSVPKLTKNSEIGKKLTLACSTSNKSFVIWKKRSKAEEWTSIITVVFEDHVHSKVYVDDYSHDEEGSLIINQVGTDDEGSYMCIYSTSDAEKAQVIEVVLFDLPNPPYTLVEGCTPGERCVLKVQREGNLTCSVKGIRPIVRLDWLPFPEHFTSYISFFDRQEVIVGNEDKYDISVTSRFTLKDADQTKLAVECRVSNWDNTLLELDKKLELHFVSDVKSGSNAGIIVVIILILLLIVALLGGLVLRRHLRKGSNKLNTDGEVVDETEDNAKSNTGGKEADEAQATEMQKITKRMEITTPDKTVDPLELNLEIFLQSIFHSCFVKDEAREHSEVKSISSDEDNISEKEKSQEEDKKKHFQEHLKSKYKNIYTVLPVPCFSKEKKCVNNFFVQRSFELLTPTGDPGAIQEIKSLFDLVNRSFDNSMRLHLKGSGKLTVFLQLAYEWCEAIKKHETDLEAFIFLNFRNCNREMSLYRTIFDVLAPDSGLNENDIGDILKSCKSGLVILYGLEKFSESDHNRESDVVKIILGDDLPQFHVVVSTMDDTHISDDLDSETQTIVINELDTKFFNDYISKNVSKNKDVISSIVANCTENPYLYKLCKIPQFFSMYASISSTKDSILNSATDVLTKILLPSEKDLRKRKYQKRLMEEGKLAEKAFELLISNKGGPFFLSLEQLISTVGKDAFERYESSGLLVRENTETDKSSSTCTTERFRFCHRIILEWYAAYHFSTVSTEENDATDTLEKIVLDALENVIYFTCGIKPDYAEKVIKVLQDHGHEGINPELWIMCLLEQEQHGRTIENVDIIKHLKNKPRIILKKTRHIFISTIPCSLISLKRSFEVYGKSCRLIRLVKLKHIGKGKLSQIGQKFPGL
ncbi:hypothetical protein HOLleu_32870 [Holothuria leucospilota]|uniref:Ig-like domain-containing protein n=1 Tax=Holothuria leucospilota TaxID=206669 RepID=A0A9Q1BJJ5_HOLLE|nr:hypothetical protein HOLleu_32870 [Holothuria leucospilota]